VRKEVELLENHPDLSADLIDLLLAGCHLHAVDGDGAAFGDLQPIDTAQQR
jgi:hypothetical protein